MAGLGGMLGGRLKSAKAIAKGRRAGKKKGDVPDPLAEEDDPNMNSPGHSGSPPAYPGDDEESIVDIGTMNEEERENYMNPRRNKAVWSHDRKKVAAQQAQDSAEEERRRFQASTQVEDILDAIPVIPDVEEAAGGGEEPEIAAPPSAIAARLDTYRVLDNELLSQQVSWNVAGLDLTVLANAVMLPKSECCEVLKPEDWDSLFTAVKSEEKGDVDAQSTTTQEPLSPINF